MDNRSDILLIEDYLLVGDTPALGILWERHRDYVYNAILAKVNFNETLADDILQDTFIKVKSAIDKGQYKDKDNIKNWISTIGRNLAMDYHRKKKRIPSHPMHKDMLHGGDDDENFDADKVWSFIGAIDDPETEIVVEETKAYTEKYLKVVLESLNDEQRRIVEMRLYEGLRFNVIAEKLDMSINTCIGRMRYAKMNMKKYIDENGLFGDDASLAVGEIAEKINPKVMSRKRKTLEYDAAKKVMQPLGLKSKKEFDALKEQGDLPEGIPSFPYQTYKVGDGTWEGWKDFLGVEAKGASSLHSEESSGHDTPEKSNEDKEDASPAVGNTFMVLSTDSAKAILKKKIEECETNIMVEQAKMDGYKRKLAELG